jgi:hypothetical protein
MKKIEDLIRSKISFNYKKANTGFEPVICAVCNDYKPRGGFKFDGNIIGFNCFNCGTDGVFEEGSTHMSKKFRKILNAFQIPDDEIDKILAENFIKNGGLNLKINSKNEEKEIITLDQLNNKSRLTFFTPEVKLPKNSIKINKTNPQNDLEKNVVNYLLKRKVLNTNHDFYISLENEFKNRVIIPFLRQGKIIYWQARSINDDVKQRYLNCPSNKTAILYNYDELIRYSDLPLFVTEGVFDAIPINGVALIGSTINEVKKELLNKVKRRIIFVIQRDKNGASLAYEALKNNWEISFPPEGFNDVNKAVIETGISWTVNMIMKNIPKNKIEAEMSILLNCSKGK